MLTISSARTAGKRQILRPKMHGVSIMYDNGWEAIKPSRKINIPANSLLRIERSNANPEYYIVRRHSYLRELVGDALLDSPYASPRSGETTLKLCPAALIAPRDDCQVVVFYDHPVMQDYFPTYSAHYIVDPGESESVSLYVLGSTPDSIQMSNLYTGKTSYVSANRVTGCGIGFNQQDLFYTVHINPITGRSIVTPYTRAEIVQLMNNAEGS